MTNIHCVIEKQKKIQKGEEAECYSLRDNKEVNLIEKGQEQSTAA